MCEIPTIGTTESFHGKEKGGDGWTTGWDKLDSTEEGILRTVIATHAEFPVDPTLTDTAKSAKAKAAALASFPASLVVVSQHQ